MKKTILIPIIILSLLLCGCSNNAGYYSTPKEAYLRGTKENCTINFELDTITLDNDFDLWVSVTTDI